MGEWGWEWMAYGVVHNDYEGVAVVAAGFAAPVAVAHSLGLRVS